MHIIGGSPLIDIEIIYKLNNYNKEIYMIKIINNYRIYN